MITVIVVDDENIARRRLVRLLEETGEASAVRGTRVQNGGQVLD